MSRRRPSTSTGPADAQDRYDAVVQELLRVCRATAAGDLEARVQAVPGAEDLPGLVELRDEFNRALDRTDAFVRESAAVLAAASEGRFHRRFLLAGMPGAFRRAATTIDAARSNMAASSDRDAQAAQQRLRLADEFEATVLAVAQTVATAATELSASAASLSHSAKMAVEEAESARSTVSDLETTSQEIQQITTLISQIASQTRLLALNATIEAARAGTAGRGFAVVASEVKSLAGQTSGATDQVIAQIAAVQSVAESSTSVMGRIGETIREMDVMVEGIAVAVDGDPAAHAQLTASSKGLSELAEMLRSEVSGFLDGLRAG